MVARDSRSLRMIKEDIVRLAAKNIIPPIMRMVVAPTRNDPTSTWTKTTSLTRLKNTVPQTTTISSPKVSLLSNLNWEAINPTKLTKMAFRTRMPRCTKKAIPAPSLPLP